MSELFIGKNDIKKNYQKLKDATIHNFVSLSVFLLSLYCSDLGPMKEVMGWISVGLVPLVPLETCVHSIHAKSVKLRNLPQGKKNAFMFVTIFFRSMVY